jgi:hypothetical protein
VLVAVGAVQAAVEREPEEPRAQRQFLRPGVQAEIILRELGAVQAVRQMETVGPVLRVAAAEAVGLYLLQVIPEE